MNWITGILGAFKALKWVKKLVALVKESKEAIDEALDVIPAFKEAKSEAEKMYSKVKVDPESVTKEELMEAYKDMVKAFREIDEFIDETQDVLRVVKGTVEEFK